MLLTLVASSIVGFEIKRYHMTSKEQVLKGFCHSMVGSLMISVCRLISQDHVVIWLV